MLPYSIPLAIVGLLESLLTAAIVDDLTDTQSDKNRECAGQGVANIASGLLGGMAGCAMIGQSVINVKSGGRGRLSTFSAGLFLLILIVFLGDWVERIPMAALVAVMIMVSIGTFSWDSLRNLRVHPKASSIVMIAKSAASWPNNMGGPCSMMRLGRQEDRVSRTLNRVCGTAHSSIRWANWKKMCDCSSSANAASTPISPGFI